MIMCCIVGECVGSRPIVGAVADERPRHSDGCQMSSLSLATPCQGSVVEGWSGWTECVCVCVRVGGFVGCLV